MREWIGLLMMALTYICFALFLWRVIWRIFLMGRSESWEMDFQRDPGAKLPVIIKGITDILFLTRLFRVNKLLWAGEIIFHYCFVFILIRHIRYFIYPVPDFLVSMQSIGIYAGYILPVSLLYIMVFKLFIENKQYLSSYNFSLLSLLLFLCITGILLKTALRADLVQIKHFMLSILMFKPALIPQSILFSIHYAGVLLFLVILPSHIFAAPYTIFDARKREENLKLIIHEN